MGLDIYYTPEPVAVDMIEFFKPSGKCLDPCRGDGVFWRLLPAGSDWCEIREGRDFFEYHQLVDWAVSNPPFSQFGRWMRHSLEIAQNIVYLIPVDKPFISSGLLSLLYQWGGVRHIRIYGPGRQFGFPIGFAVGAVHFEKGYRGKIGVSLNYAVNSSACVR